MAKIHTAMSKTATRMNGEAGPSESNIGPPTTLYPKAARSMKNVRSIVMAPRTSFGKFFIKRDSRATTCRVEKTIKSATSRKPYASVGSSTYLNI